MEEIRTFPCSFFFLEKVYYLNHFPMIDQIQLPSLPSFSANWQSIRLKAMASQYCDQVISPLKNSSSDCTTQKKAFQLSVWIPPITTISLDVDDYDNDNNDDVVSHQIMMMIMRMMLSATR